VVAVLVFLAHSRRYESIRAQVNSSEARDHAVETKVQGGAKGRQHRHMDCTCGMCRRRSPRLHVHSIQE
jgi:hypothetical protein